MIDSIRWCIIWKSLVADPLFTLSVLLLGLIGKIIDCFSTRYWLGSVRQELLWTKFGFGILNVGFTPFYW